MEGISNFFNEQFAKLRNGTEGGKALNWVLAGSAFGLSMLTAWNYVIPAFGGGVLTNLVALPIAATASFYIAANAPGFLRGVFDRAQEAFDSTPDLMQTAQAPSQQVQQTVAEGRVAEEEVAMTNIGEFTPSALPPSPVDNSIRRA